MWIQWFIYMWLVSLNICDSVIHIHDSVTNICGTVAYFYDSVWWSDSITSFYAKIQPFKDFTI